MDKKLQIFWENATKFQTEIVTRDKDVAKFKGRNISINFCTPLNAKKRKFSRM